MCWRELELGLGRGKHLLAQPDVVVHRIADAEMKQHLDLVVIADMALPGNTSVPREVERARLIRESIGDEIDLMCE